MSSVPALLSADDLAALGGDVVVLDASTHLTTSSDGVPYTVHPHRDEFLAGHVPGGPRSAAPGGPSRTAVAGSPRPCPPSSPTS